LFNIPEIKEELIEIKKKDFENNTYHFVEKLIERLSHDVFKPFSSLIVGIVFSTLKTVFIEGSIGWYIFICLSIFFFSYAVYILIKNSIIKSNVCKKSNSNTKQVEILRNKAIADNNGDFQSAVNHMTSNPIDIELQALIEYSKEQKWI